ncbi:hypothetical protein [Enterovibrio gelatinilyticus]|nr:hypothetical protein [Enterovibrio sp. ZSDZ42]
MPVPIPKQLEDAGFSKLALMGSEIEHLQVDWVYNNMMDSP